MFENKDHTDIVIDKHYIGIYTYLGIIMEGDVSFIYDPNKTL